MKMGAAVRVRVGVSVGLWPEWTGVLLCVAGCTVVHVMVTRAVVRVDGFELCFIPRSSAEPATAADGSGRWLALPPPQRAASERAGAVAGMVVTVSSFCSVPPWDCACISPRGEDTCALRARASSTGPPHAAPPITPQVPVPCPMRSAAQQR